MGICFVIQPFDAGPFDKRYEDVFVPAIEDAGLEPYRVDRDPAATIPIQDIEEGIRRADSCLADISLSNPNVWFELGFAIAAGKPVVLVYGHYDVQPPDPLDEWTSPPFEPTRRDGDLYARGATDDKGQMLTHVKSAQAWMEVSEELPVQLKFLIEGEEEVGSHGLNSFLDQKKKSN